LRLGGDGMKDRRRDLPRPRHLHATELGYLARHFPDAALLARFDAIRRAEGQDSLTALDGADRYSLSRHSRGDNASALIYACTYGDFLSPRPRPVDIVAVTGNSMGWYSALACAGAADARGGVCQVVNTMGTLMQEALIGGQMVYPWVDEDWQCRALRARPPAGLVAEIAARPRHAWRCRSTLAGCWCWPATRPG
jgi:[acyl-carrier-protein] S-malonyltransferase